MKIAIVSPYAPPEKGAATVRATSFANHFQKAGNSTIIFAPKRENVRDSGTNIEIIRYKGKLDLISHFLKNKFDVVLATTPPATVTFDSIIASKLSRIPVVVDIRDPWSYASAKLGYISDKSFTYQKNVLREKLSYKYADKLFVVSSFVENIISQHFKVKSEKFKVVPNGVEIELFRRDVGERKKIRDKLSIDQKVPVIIYEGILGKEKELDKFLNHCGRDVVKKYGAHILFAVIVDDEYSVKYAKNLEKKVCKVGIENNFHLINQVEYEDMYKYLSAADVGLNPLSREMGYCLPIKTFEYLACELPVVCKAPPAGALYSFIEKYDVGFFSDSWRDFRDKLISALSNLEDFKKKGIYGRKVIEKKFNREKANEIALSEINRLLGQSM